MKSRVAHRLTGYDPDTELLAVEYDIPPKAFANIADRHLVLLNNCGHWPPFEKPAEWTAQVLAFLKGY